LWLKIQEAYETLINEKTRREYDSKLPFDDRIPAPDVDDINDTSFYDM
jgi:curved DNA-binding protein CbpA